MNCELMFLKEFSKLWKKSTRSFVIKFLFRKLQVYKLQASAFRVKYWKIPEIKFTVEFLFTEAGATGSPSSLIVVLNSLMENFQGGLQMYWKWTLRGCFTGKFPEFLLHLFI